MAQDISVTEIEKVPEAVEGYKTRLNTIQQINIDKEIADRNYTPARATPGGGNSALITEVAKSQTKSSADNTGLSATPVKGISGDTGSKQ